MKEELCFFSLVLMRGKGGRETMRECALIFKSRPLKSPTRPVFLLSNNGDLGFIDIDSTDSRISAHGSDRQMLYGMFCNIKLV